MKPPRPPGRPSTIQRSSGPGVVDAVAFWAVLALVVKLALDRGGAP